MKQFEKVEVRGPKSSIFNLTHENKLTLKMGKLYPIMCEEIIPSDNFKVSTNLMMRCETMLAPIMHMVNVYFHYFFVPYRLIWDDSEKFFTGDYDGMDETSVPIFTGNITEYRTRMGVSSLGDYFGLPIKQFDSTQPVPPISQLPFRAYVKIFKDYYADETFDTTPDVYTDSEDKALSGGWDMLKLKYRNWEKDYFTSALPWTQRGDQVTLPLGDTAPIIYDASGNPDVIRLTNGLSGGVSPNTMGINYNSSNTNNELAPGTGLSAAGTIGIDNSENIQADLSDATAASINTLRSAYALQRWLEKNARGGARYTELILSHFGVKSKDSRLQRAEYLGGSKEPLKISEVLQTSESTTGSPLGDFAGHGYATGNSNEWSAFFHEHGLVLGIMSVLPKTSYYNGIPRFFGKTDRFDFFWPDFANIGEQEVFNKEVYFQDSADNNELAFGYQPRYEEYRHRNDRVCGEFRDSKDFWHLGREMDSIPTLSEEFIKAEVTERFLPAEYSDTDYLLAQLRINIIAKRPIPKHGTPL